jgi:hypothetical protein
MQERAPEWLLCISTKAIDNHLVGSKALKYQTQQLSDARYAPSARQSKAAHQVTGKATSQPSHHGSFMPGQAVLGNGYAQPRQPQQDRLQCHLQFHPGEVSSQAEVGSVAPVRQLHLAYRLAAAQLRILRVWFQPDAAERVASGNPVGC